MQKPINNELEQIIKSAEKVIQYNEADPETALLLARKSVETICRNVYQKELNVSSERVSLGQMIEALSRGKSILPKKVMSSLRVIQNFGGVNAHENVDECLEPTLAFFPVVIKWYFEDYRKIDIPNSLNLHSLDKKLIFPATGEQVILLSNFTADEELTEIRPKNPFSDRANDSKRIHSFSQEVNVDTSIIDYSKPDSSYDISYGVLFKYKPFLQLEIVKGDIINQGDVQIKEQRKDDFTFSVHRFDITKTARGTSYSLTNVERVKFTVSGELE